MMLAQNIHPLNNEQMRSRAPAIFADRPAGHVSGNYKFVRTIDVIDRFRESGWEVLSVAQQKTRRGSTVDPEVTKHNFVLRNKRFDVVDGNAGYSLGGVIPTISGINSHNWASSLELSAGCFRFLCTNGLIAQGAEFGGFAVRHDHVMEDIGTIINRFDATANTMIEKIMGWRQFELSPETLRTFARMAAKIRYGDEATDDHARALLYARRQSDVGNDLWTVFNVLQENAMKGGQKYGNMSRTTRTLTNIGRQSEMNKALWSLADMTFHNNGGGSM